MIQVINFSVETNTIIRILSLGFLGFVLSMVITPIYTHLSYKGQWWKKPREKAVTGETATVFKKNMVGTRGRGGSTFHRVIGPVAIYHFIK